MRPPLTTVFQRPVVVRSPCTLHTTHTTVKCLHANDLTKVNATPILIQEEQYPTLKREVVTVHPTLGDVSSNSTSPSSQVLRPLAIGNAAKQLAKHKQVYRWATVLTKFTAGTVLESANQDDMPTLAVLTEFFATQGLPAALTESTRKNYDSDWRGWVTFCVVMQRPDAILPADKQVWATFMLQLILCQYATGTIGKFLSCMVTKHRQFDTRHR